MTMMAMAEVPCLCARPSLAVPARRPGTAPRPRGVARLCPIATTAGRGVGAVRAAVVEAAAAVEDDEEEAAVEERYALGGACRVLAGMPAPLGATALAGGVNFAVYSSGATAATLCLFTPDDLKANRVTEEVLLDPVINRTGNVWHVFVEGELHDMLYGYRFDGTFAPQCGQYFDVSNVVVDPYAKAVISRGEYGVPAPGGDCWPQMAGMIPLPYSTLDLEEDSPNKSVQGQRNYVSVLQLLVHLGLNSLWWRCWD